MDEVLAQYKWTADELLLAQHIHSRQGLAKYFRVLVKGLIVFLCAIGLLSLVFGQIGGAILLAIGLFLFVLHTVIEPWRMRRQFRIRPDQGVEVEWRFSRDTN